MTRSALTLILLCWPFWLMAASVPFRVELVDAENQWPVPMVELRTTHGLRYHSDNAGLVAVDAPELIGREVYFHVHSHGYGLEPDGFGMRGFRATPQWGGRVRVELRRGILAKRLGRLTGGGLFAESAKLGETRGLEESGVFGCDSILLARHRDRLFALWGDTTLPHYPLGVFHSTAATLPLSPLDSFEPPLALSYEHFRNPEGRPRAVATMPGDGPTWLGGMISLPSPDGPRLVATYSKIRGALEEYETGLCVWDETGQCFRRHRVLWTHGQENRPEIPRGHPFRWKDERGGNWVLFGDPFPRLRIPDEFAAWEDPSRWILISPPEPPPCAVSGQPVEPHRGSVAWNAHRKRWVTVYTQSFGKPSAWGEIHYAEAETPFGPWGPAVKILSHDNMTFYNPRMHPEWVPEEAAFLLFEGTFTTQFADHAVAVPRYDYNQICYRLDLDDPALSPARVVRRR